MAWLTPIVNLSPALVKVIKSVERPAICLLEDIRETGEESEEGCDGLVDWSVVVEDDCLTAR